MAGSRILVHNQLKKEIAAPTTTETTDATPWKTGIKYVEIQDQTVIIAGRSTVYQKFESVWIANGMIMLNQVHMFTKNGISTVLIQVHTV